MAGFYRSFSDKYQYWAKPEGQDPLGKIFGLAKHGWATSIFLTIYDANLISKCQNTVQFFNTAGYYFVPITTMCFAYSSVTYAMTHLRGKADAWNGVIGALSAGGVLHAWQKRPVISGWGTFYFVLYSVLRTDYEKNKHKYDIKGLIIRPDAPPQWLFPTRNMDLRSTGSAFKHDRESYWRNFNINTN